MKINGKILKKIREEKQKLNPKENYSIKNMAWLLAYRTDQSYRNLESWNADGILEERWHHLKDILKLTDEEINLIKK